MPGPVVSHVKPERAAASPVRSSLLTNIHVVFLHLCTHFLSTTPYTTNLTDSICFLLFSSNLCWNIEYTRVSHFCHSLSAGLWQTHGRNYFQQFIFKSWMLECPSNVPPRVVCIPSSCSSTGHIIGSLFFLWHSVTSPGAVWTIQWHYVYNSFVIGQSLV